jgi:hypothetical protein
MTSKPDWNLLDHADKLNILRNTPISQIVSDYSFGEQDESFFREKLVREQQLWQPQLFDTAPKRIGRPPNKEVVLGAWRDLDRSEAILELIDNSIDAWNRRLRFHPNKCAPELNIYIDIDSDTGQLTYEDNAGGVPIDKLENLVVPGHSETEALVASIGSYKTGGKKAVFRLATAVNITTKFWNPAETGDTAVAVHLDEQWLNDVTEYEFPYFELKSSGELQKGQTRYVMQLRPEPLGTHWYHNPRELAKIDRDIRNTYGLLIARNSAIKMYFPKRGIKVSPNLDALYDFSGTFHGKIDIRPQTVAFETELEYLGKYHPVTVEVTIGCRTTAATGENLGPGFDLYGNNRMFKYRDERLFHDLLPKGSVSSYIRGWVNIIGPNVFVPWDTHKRHLNYDRDVIELLRTHPTIKSLFENWGDAFKQISGLGRGEVTKTVNVPYQILDLKKNKLRIPHVATVSIDAAHKRGHKLPDEIFKPAVLSATKTKKDVGVALNMFFTTDEARRLAAKLEVHGALDSTKTRRLLSEKAKEHLLSFAGRRRAKRS